MKTQDIPTSMEARDHAVTLKAAGLPTPFIAWRNGEHGSKRTTAGARAAFRAAFHPYGKEEHLAARQVAHQCLYVAKEAARAAHNAAITLYGQGRPFGTVKGTRLYPAGTWEHWPGEVREQIYAADRIVNAWTQLVQEHHIAAGLRLSTLGK